MRAHKFKTALVEETVVLVVKLSTRSTLEGLIKVLIQISCQLSDNLFENCQIELFYMQRCSL